MASIALKNISREFEQVKVINNISFSIPDGEFWVLVGPSGCGKSTILRIIAGLETASEGQIYIDDTMVNHLKARQRDVAMVFQNYALYPHMTVAENLGFGLKMRQVNSTTITQQIEAVAHSLNIENLLKRKPKQLSGGQQQRVALGRAIIRQPKVFLLDEPLSNLDAQLRDDMRAELKQLHARLGITTIYVTHDQIEAMTLADQIVVLNQGEIQQIGSPQEIYNQPANRMVATFLGNPPMNILPATYINETLIIYNQSIQLSAKIANYLQSQPQQKFDIGIRPEYIYFDSETNHDSASLTIEIQVIEPLGREVLIKGNLPNSTSIINFFVPASWQGKIGDRIKINLDLEQLLIFDVATGKKLVSD